MVAVSHGPWPEIARFLILGWGALAGVVVRASMRSARVSMVAAGVGRGVHPWGIQHASRSLQGAAGAAPQSFGGAVLSRTVRVVAISTPICGGSCPRPSARASSVAAFAISVSG